MVRPQQDESSTSLDPHAHGDGKGDWRAFFVCSVF